MWRKVYEFKICNAEMKELNMDIESEVLSAVAKKSWGYSATQSSQSQHDIFREHIAELASS